MSSRLAAVVDPIEQMTHAQCRDRMLEIDRKLRELDHQQWELKHERARLIDRQRAAYWERPR